MARNRPIDTESLINRAERYQALGRSLPADLYSALMENGIDASQFNIDSPSEQENTND